jgi:hypothetical protein
MKNLFFILFIIVIFNACASNIPSSYERKSKALSLVKNKNFTEVDIETSTFNLFSLQQNNINCQNKDLKIYIEGDGLSWITRRIISKDPTPVNSTILKLINQDNYDCKLYLARPCQFVNSLLCKRDYWTNLRFSDEVIKSFDESLNHIKDRYKNSSFTLIGHSGGGAVAAILASKREDISMLISIAGNLDIDRWTSLHKLSKLEGSLNPADYTKNLENIKQYHFIGNNDDIIPKEIFLSYLSKFDKKNKIDYGFFDENHNCCWEKPYKFFLEKSR